MAEKPPVWITSTKDEPRTCPVCHRVLDGTTSISTDPAEKAPKMRVDDLSVCAYCGTILTVTTLGFRPATDEDLADVSPTNRELLFELSREHSRGGRA